MSKKPASPFPLSVLGVAPTKSDIRRCMKPTRERKEVGVSVAVVVQGGGSSKSFTGVSTPDGLL